MNNQINGISPKDRNIGKYMHAARGIAKYLDNQITGIQDADELFSGTDI